MTSTPLLEREAPPAPLQPPPPAFGRRQRRAKRTMVIVTAVCISAALAPAAERLVRFGWRAFVTRPPGVGASDDAPEAAADSQPPSSAPRAENPAPAATPEAPQQAGKKANTPHRIKAPKMVKINKTARRSAPRVRVSRHEERRRRRR